MGEFLMNAQGEDVVAGVRTPSPIAKLQEVMPEVYSQFVDICHILEDHYRDMQDVADVHKQMCIRDRLSSVRMQVITRIRETRSWEASTGPPA